MCYIGNVRKEDGYMEKDKLYMINKIFDNKKVRTVWDKESEKYYVSIIDIIEVLTGSARTRKYWSDLKKQLTSQGSEVSEKIGQLKLKTTDGKYYEEKLEDIPEEVRDEFEKAISLRVIDNYWMEHISTMSHLRDGIGLRGYANTSPLQAYTMEGYQLFDEMIAKINRDISIYLLKSEIRQNIERKQVAKNAITNDSKDHAKVQKKSTKVGRNDPCPCGSGKKYKNCCGK